MNQKEEEKKGTIFFYLGWPKMLDLLGPLFSILRRDFQLIIFGQKSTFPFCPEERVIGIAYSAGSRSLLKAVKKNPENFSLLVFIAPAGSAIMPNPLLVHYWRFFLEILKLAGSGKWRIAWGAAKETVLNFLRHPLESFGEVEEIRKFDFWAEIHSIEKLPPRFFIFPANDNLICSCRGKAREIGVYFVDNLSSGHFGLVENSRQYNEYIRQIIDLKKQADELQKRKGW